MRTHLAVPCHAPFAKAFAAAVFSLLVLAHEAQAQAMPWESPARRVIDSLTGPTAQLLVMCGTALVGLGFMFEQGGIYRRGCAVVGGGAIAVGAPGFVGSLFGV